MYSTINHIPEDADNSLTYCMTLGKLVKDNGSIFWERIIEKVAQQICGNSNVRFRQIVTEHSYSQLIAARKRMYNQRDSYFGMLMSDDGSDELDCHSYLFAAYLGENIIGSIRLTPNPFEVCKYIDKNNLNQFIGNTNFNRYLEISRLVIDREIRMKGLARALIVFSGLLCSLTTHYDHYLAIARPEVKNRSFDFNFYDNVLPFSIPERGDHIYHLSKGYFISDFYEIMSNNSELITNFLATGQMTNEKVFQSF